MKKIYILFILAPSFICAMQKPEKEKAPRAEAFDFKEEYQKLGKNYPVLADALPEDYKLPLIIYFNKQDPARLQEANKSVGKASVFVWRSLNKILDLGLKDDEIRKILAIPIFFSIQKKQLVDQDHMYSLQYPCSQPEKMWTRTLDKSYE